MIRIEPYTTQESPIPGAFGTGGPARALQVGDLGQGLRVAAGVAGEYVDAAERQKAADDAARLAGRMAEGRLYWTQEIDRLQQSAPPGADGFTPQVLQRFKQWSDQQLADETDPRARQLLQTHLVDLQTNVVDDALKFEAGARREHRQVQTEDAIGKAASAVFANPDSAEAVLGDLDGVLQTYKLGADGERIGQQAKQTIAAAYLRGLVERDPDRALREAQSGEGLAATAELGTLASVTNQAQTAIKARQIEAEQRAREARYEQRQREAEAKAAERERKQDARFKLQFSLRDELAAAERGESSGADLAGAMAAAGLDPEEAKAELDRIDTARDTALTAKEFAAMTPAEMDAAIAERAPSGEGYALEAGRQDALTKARQIVLEARQQDPGAAVLTAYPEIAKDLQSEDPARRRDAILRSAQVQRETFGLQPQQIQPLPKAVTAQLVDQVKAAGTAEEKLQILAPLTSGLGDDAAGRQVLGQLEAAGLPSGTAAAMERMRDGEPENARAILTAITVDPAKQAARQKVAGVDEAVADLFDGQGPAAAAQRAAAMSGQPGAAAQAARDAAALKDLTRQNMATGDDAATAAQKAERTLYGGRETLVDPTIAAVRLPKGVDPATAEANLKALRANAALPAVEGQDPRLHAAKEQDLREDGVFVTSGDGVALLDPVTGEVVMTYTWGEVLGFGRKADVMPVSDASGPRG